MNANAGFEKDPPFFFNFNFMMHIASPLLMSFSIFDSPIPLFVSE
jgi:hypothetical protein